MNSKDVGYAASDTLPLLTYLARFKSSLVDKGYDNSRANHTTSMIANFNARLAAWPADSVTQKNRDYRSGIYARPLNDLRLWRIDNAPAA